MAPRITKLHPQYRELLRARPQIEKYFLTSLLPVKGERFKLLKMESIVHADAPLLMLMAGCHGEEPASVLALFKRYKVLAESARRYGVSLVVYPLVNPWGFDRNYRYNRHGLNCNRNWVHDHGRKSGEVKTLMNDMRQYRPTVFASLHEDDDVWNAFYLFSFGDRRFEKPILAVGKKFFPILPDDSYGDSGSETILSGVCYDNHDHTAEDYMAHRGCIFTCCTETTSHAPLLKRVRCYEMLLPELVRLTARFAQKH